MRRTGIIRLLAAGIGTLLLSSAHQRIPVSAVMTNAAGNLLAALSPDQLDRTVLRFEDEERFNWHYVPRVRRGLPFKDMTAAQKHLAQALLSAGLSQSGSIKAATIMSLEEVLRVIENDNGARRNPEGYHFSLFGTPAVDGVWGYRVEGHHLSLNFTIVRGLVTGSPNFFGANPAEVRQGPRKGLRALAREEDLARDLLDALKPEQRTVAIVDAAAPADILTAASRKAALEGRPSGLPVSRMSAAQRRLLHTLLEEYAGNLPPELAAARMAKVEAAGGNLFFAWAGGASRGQPHYYRIQAPAFLVEYDNTQNNANHIHSVWRDFEGDFGLDLLKAHYQTSHR